MVKKIIFVSILFSLVSARVFAQTTETVSVNAVAEQKPSVLKEGLELEHAGKYLEALDIYNAVQAKKTLSKKSAKKLRDRIEKLNIKLLFSPTLTPGSVIYEVKDGDSLYAVARAYGTTRAMIKKSNHLEDDTIKVGMKLKVLDHATFMIHVDKSKNMMVVYMNRKVLKHYRVATGIGGATPVGEFKIINKIENPTWYKTGTVVEPGDPKNYLGTRWLGLDAPGYGIHGTTSPESIGHQTTSGCVRMLNREVEELFIFIPQGTVVKITE